MRVLIFTAMVLVCHAAGAEVFKCTGAFGKTVYQEKPCQAAVKSQQLDIKGDPAKETEAKSRLEALEAENNARKAKRLQEEKDAAAQRSQVEQLDALKRSASAQQQQAVAEQRQAEALEKQNQQNNNPVLILPGYSTQHRLPGERIDHDSGLAIKRHEQRGDSSKREQSSEVKPDMQ